MPRLIDHSRREHDIGEAALRVLVRDGLAALSVRNVAEEAGIATASLRRAFPSQDALRQFCLDRVREDVGARIQALQGKGAEFVLAMLCELLPLDEHRRRELIIQLQFGALALTDESVAGHVAELHREVRGVCEAAVTELARHGLLREGSDLAVESERLHGLLDGLAVQALWHPVPDAGSRAVSVLEYHLATLTDNESPAT